MCSCPPDSVDMICKLNDYSTTHLKILSKSVQIKNRIVSHFKALETIKDRDQKAPAEKVTELELILSEGNDLNAEFKQYPHLTELRIVVKIDPASKQDLSEELIPLEENTSLLKVTIENAEFKGLDNIKRICAKK